MKKLIIVILISSALFAKAQLPAAIMSWQINTDSTGFAGILTDAHQLNFSLANICQQFTGTIYDQAGELIETRDVIPNNAYSYNAGELAAGIYFLKVELKTNHIHHDLQ